MKKPITRTPFTRFQIPPDFYLVDLHAECALPYAEPKPNQTRMQYCPCCQRNKNDERLPLCLDTHKLLKMG